MYRYIVGSVLLTPREGARASLYAATRSEALEVPGLAPYFTSECVARWGNTRLVTPGCHSIGHYMDHTGCDQSTVF